MDGTRSGVHRSLVVETRRFNSLADDSRNHVSARRKLKIQMTHNKQTKFFPGDMVEVRPLHEILATLDANGTLEKLPFMPEMTAFAGQQFRVTSRAFKT